MREEKVFCRYQADKKIKRKIKKETRKIPITLKARNKKEMHVHNVYGVWTQMGPDYFI